MQEFLVMDVIRSDTIPECSPVHPENCKRKASNQYERNCETEEQCRSDGDEEEEDDDYVEGGDGEGGKTLTFKIRKFKNAFPKFDAKVQIVWIEKN
ncbi:hypothetical protein TIFTF001_046280 [Ficus carica]|uniref:Uncharacterized protein n=1 Tax=Ficus carica TaxID=3494 RepID=A0AA88D6Z3_FICCA|nr:hypothetical protein TIFTF001_046280 [Ficus carica]